jgi:hypothetical protein
VVGDIPHALTVDPDLAAVVEALEKLRAGIGKLCHVGPPT